MNTRNRTTAYVLGAALAITLSGLACSFESKRSTSSGESTGELKGSGIFVEPNPVCDHKVQ